MQAADAGVDVMLSSRNVLDRCPAALEVETWLCTVARGDRLRQPHLIGR